LQQVLPARQIIEIIGNLDQTLKQLNERLKIEHTSLVNAMRPKPKTSVQDQIKSKWIVNLSGKVILETQNQVLEVGQNFALAPKRLPTHKIIAFVEKSLYKVGQLKPPLFEARWYKLQVYYNFRRTNNTI